MKPGALAFAVRLLARRELMRALPCQHCVLWSPGFGCPKLEACLADQERLRKVAEGKDRR